MHEGLETLPKTASVTLHEQWVRCGKPGCRCRAGELHGPYYYLFWRDEGRQRKRYVRQSDVAALRDELEGLARERRRRRELECIFRTRWRDLRDQLREVEQWMTR